MSDNKKPPEPNLDAFSKFLGETDHSAFLDKEGAVIDVEAVPEPTRQLASDLVKEFACMECQEPFDRIDCKITKGGVMVSISKCPFCKSDRVIRQRESGWAAERKYDVSIEDATLGQKPGRYAGLATKNAFISGKIKRKK